MNQHALKCDPDPFAATWMGLKDFELRFNDRNFRADDWVELRETKYSAQEMGDGRPLVYTGRGITRQISYVGAHLVGLEHDWVILSFRHFT